MSEPGHDGGGEQERERGAVTAPTSRRRASERHPGTRSWTNWGIPLLLVLCVAGFGAVQYTGRARGGFTRIPTRAENRRELCRRNLADLVAVWRSTGRIPSTLWHEHWGGQDGLACANDDAIPYVVRDLERFPVDPTRAADEPIAACLGLSAATKRWTPPHGTVVLVAFADGEVRDLSWTDLGLPETPPPGAPPPVVGPDAGSPILGRMTAR